MAISLSGGACSTMTTEPIKHVAHPSFPKVPRRSFRKYAPSTDLSQGQVCHVYMARRTISYPMSTLRAPNGVTRIAGAKAYAAKFAISPRTTARPISLRFCRGLARCRRPTCDNASPPYRTFQIFVALAFKSMSFACFI